MSFPTAQSQAQDTEAAKVEFTVWSRDYAGTLGNKSVQVSLNRVGDKLSGNYCYEPCAAATRYQLTLDGTLEGDRAALHERDKPNAQGQQPVTGEWKIDALTTTGVTGNWTTPDGKRRLPLKLSERLTGKPFPFEIRLVADHLPDSEGCSFDVPHVSEIRLYRDNKPVQSLATDSTGTCSIFTPQIVDMNFDGWPDLMLAQALPAGPNIPYDSWLYVPSTGRFAESPPALLEVTAPAFDAEHKLVWNFSRGSCCEHAIDIYRWKGEALEHIDNGESYYMPVKVGGKLSYCYVTPDYVDGHIEYPGAVWDTGRPWSIPAADVANCEPADNGSAQLGRARVDVWRKGVNGAAPVQVRSEEMKLQRVNIAGKPMDCPSVPVLDGGKISRVLMTGEDECFEPTPGADKSAKP